MTIAPAPRPVLKDDPVTEARLDELAERLAPRVAERALLLMQAERRPAAMKVREALLALLRGWEDLFDLPRSVPTRVERGEVVRPERREHHNR
ncbi:MAG TPA: hypothetical protein VFZ66_29885 [Herpetosiphonaceae bacterium]